ncbi:hypothetical protein RN001_001718 [Aquatica leii]|uniref:Regulatory protein zeste n=1 Tax=Aquatica leii TaxID=1421715 RepID=A0AAN7PGA5_9COLE|nr:hypothetical protein RN001_001718 [Aquatica leii]
MEKRERAGNFTESEKEIMTSITSKYFSIIENKKTDAITIKQKTETWERIADEFNSSANNVKRTGLQLKNAYNNLKKRLKKENAEDKIELYKTGGGVAPLPKMTEEKSRLLSLLQPQLEPVKSRFDSTANFIIEDYPIVDAEDICIEEKVHEPPPKKKKVCDIYETVQDYTKKKTQKHSRLDQKLEIEIEILQIKKQREEELLNQQKFNTLKAELEYLIVKKQFDELNKN